MFVRSLKGSLTEITARVSAAHQVLVLLAYDGTLAPYHPDPDQARMPDPARDWLGEIAGSPRVAVGIISGRRLNDLNRCVGLEGIVYSGNHGIEIRGRGLQYLEPFAFLLEPAVKLALAELAVRLGDLPRVWVENKTLTGTVHLAGGKIAEIARAERTIHSVLHAYPNLRCLASRRSFEILPQNGWTKGSAAQWIQRRLGMDRALVIYVGDDTSDEEAFEVLPGAITIKVGDETTLASYVADSPVEVWALLARLAGVLTFPRSLDASAPAKSRCAAQDSEAALRASGD